MESLAGKLGFPLKHLYVIDGSKRSSHSNAYFYGLPWSKHIVVYDTLMDKSSPHEVEAVLGHELGHWYYCALHLSELRTGSCSLSAHPARLLAVSLGHVFANLTTFSIFMNNASLYRAFGFDPILAKRNPYGGPQPILIGSVLFNLILSPLEGGLKFGMNYLTRKYEYQAGRLIVTRDFALNSLIQRETCADG